MTETRSYEDLSTDPPERESRPSDLVADDLPEVDLGEQSGQSDERPSLDDIEEALKDVVDPELGINVVDLGLVYGLNFENASARVLTLVGASSSVHSCPTRSNVIGSTVAVVSVGTSRGAARTPALVTFTTGISTSGESDRAQTRSRSR